LTISLPSSWTRKLGLSAGDEVDVNISDNVLLVAAEQQSKKREITIDLADVPAGIMKTYIYYIYINGYDEVTLKNVETKVCDDISNYINSMIGYEIIDETKGIIKIRDFSGDKEESFDQILRRIFLLIIAFAEDGTAMLKSKKVSSFKEFARRDHTVNKFVAYCLRTLNKKGHKDYKRTTIYYTVIHMLEALSDEFARLFFQLGSPIQNGTIKHYEETVNMCRKMYGVFYNFDKKEIQDLILWRNEFRNKIATYMSKRHVNDNKVLYRLSKVAEFAVDVLRLRISLEI